MRIVGGEFRGRTIHAPAGLDVRPTTDRVREAIFNILTHSDFELQGARILDLFAGSGAMGLEALSRGGVYALFVEEVPAARAAIRRNIEALSLAGRTRVFRRDASKLGPLPAGIRPFTLVFLDPPYGKGFAPLALKCLAAGGWLAPTARLVVETRAGEDLDLPEGFRLLDDRTYGDTEVRFLLYQ